MTKLSRRTDRIEGREESSEGSEERVVNDMRILGEDGVGTPGGSTALRGEGRGEDHGQASETRVASTCCMLYRHYGCK